ncbi:hypothetical protein CUR178_02877 [Leishmania enriettii]|uniref:Uncharacterized protein n=1 Tax=Leishmania enriettii TaxID=5663 RepID=A0A836GC59_LEIEN|nr:hypothetical protein CUR178_02877 [Leishmania enriettii]
MSVAPASGTSSRGPSAERCGVRTVTANITSVVCDPYSTVETSLQFSSSSSFRSASPPIDKKRRTDVRVFATITASSEGRRVVWDSVSHMSSPPSVSPYPLAHGEGEVLHTAGQVPIPARRTASSSRPASRHRASDSARTAANSEHRSFSTIRDSAFPPAVSTFFGGAAAAAGQAARAEETSMSLMQDTTSLQDIQTPRSTMKRAASTVQVSPATSPMPLALPSHLREMEASDSSLPVEFSVVNADRARAAHEWLASLSADTIARYRLVKLTVTQRIYRVYFGKWLSEIRERKTAESLQRLSKDTQTNALRYRSLSQETDFADVDSFHVSRSISPTVDVIRADVGAAVAPGSAQPSRHVMVAPSPSPPREGEWGQRGISVSCSSAPGFRLQTFARASPSPESLPSEHCTRTNSVPSHPPPTDGIAVRTKPATLVDFGHHSAAPQRSTSHPASVPVVQLPAVVPSPVRILRV